MSGGRFAGVLVALPLAFGACGGRAELDDAGAGGVHSAGGKSAGGKANGVGGAQPAGAPGNGGQPGVGGAFVTGGAFVAGGAPGGAPWGGATHGGTGNGGAAGSPSGGSGVGGSMLCPPCRAYTKGACSYEVCDPGSRKCIPVSLDGQSCDDHDFCTVGEFCRAGVCQGGTKNTCGLSEDTCTAVECRPEGFCALTSQRDGSACKSGDLCATNAACFGGKCVTTTSRDCSNLRVPGQCYAGQCNASTGNCEAVPLSGIACNTLDLCSQGICVSGSCLPQATIDCSWADTQCTYGECVAGGTCVSRNYPDGSSCFTEACVQDSICSSGVCKPGTPITACVSGDGCCPAGCTGKVDFDCASSFSVEALDRGWWNSLGDHESTNDNTFTGSLDSNSYNSYFTFDLRGLAQNVQGATLLLEQENYFGTDRSEQISVWDVSTDASTLEANGLPRNTAIFDDLQSGSRYASLTVYPSDVGSVLTIQLNAAAIANINAARGGFFSVGVHLDTPSGAVTHVGEGVRFSESAEYRTHQLQLDTF